VLKLIEKYPKIKRLAYRLLAATPSSYRLGKEFWKWYSFFEESEDWDLIKIKQFQVDRIRSLLVELAMTSEFYHKRFAFFEVHKITSLEEFCAQVPTLSKLEFKSQYKKILSSSWQAQNSVKSQTSGTTGMPIQFYHPAKDGAREWAAICHQWKRVGFSPTASRRAEFRGLTGSQRIVESFPHKNKIRCSILNLKREHIVYYADEIRKNRIDYYHGYPSALYLLAMEIISSGIKFPQPKAVLLASEIVYEWQVNRIQEAFPEAKIFAHYGCAERTVLAGWCEYRREYHVLPQYGILEVDGNTSEIIGTNLYNSVNGFIRYLMTDTATGIDYTPCPGCHRPYTPRLTNIAGRSEDFLFSPEKGWIPPAIVTYPLKSLQVVREVQFHQKEKTEICVRYLAQSSNPLLNDDLNQIKSGMHHVFGSNMSFKFEQVEDFKRGSTGKFQWIVSDLEEMPSR